MPPSTSKKQRNGKRKSSPEPHSAVGAPLVDQEVSVGEVAPSNDDEFGSTNDAQMALKLVERAQSEASRLQVHRQVTNEAFESVPPFPSLPSATVTDIATKSADSAKVAIPRTTLSAAVTVPGAVAVTPNLRHVNNNSMGGDTIPVNMPPAISSFDRQEPLLQAQLVEDSDSDDVEANGRGAEQPDKESAPTVEVKMEVFEAQALPWWSRRGLLLVAICVAMVALALGVGLGMGIQKDKATEDYEKLDRSIARHTSLLDAMPGDQQEAVSTPGSLLNWAYNWVIDDPNLNQYSVPNQLQRYALAVLYTATGGSDVWHDRRPNWVTYTDECDRWQPSHVPPDCDDAGLYTVLNLTGVGLENGVPREIGMLRNLEVLDLSNNHLIGIPSEIGDLSNLEVLLLNGNYTSLFLPSTLASIPRLRILHLEDNDITGTIPPTICNMRTSQGLELLVDCDLLSCDCGCDCSDEESAAFVASSALNDDAGAMLNGSDSGGGGYQQPTQGEYYGQPPPSSSFGQPPPSDYGPPPQ